MRFKCSVTNIDTFTKLTTSLQTLGQTAWLRLSTDDVRFVLHQSQVTQVWATLETHQLFDNYEIASAAGNVINLEVPLAVLTRALKSCAAASDVVLRLTKRQSDKCPILSLTIITAASHSFARGGSNTLVTQEVPVRVLSSASVDSIVEPRAPAPSVLIQLPPLGPVRSVSERFLRIGGQEGKVAISANKEGRFRMRFDADEVKIESCWRNQQNMEAEPVDGSAVARPTQEQRRQFKEVLVDCKEWVKVLKVSNLAKRVVACICEGHALVLYGFLSESEAGQGNTVLTYYINSFNA